MNGTEQINNLTGQVISAAIRVHTTLGPGLLEHTYRKCLAYELGKLAIRVEKEVPLDLKYDDLVVLGAYRLDLVIEDMIIVEVKAIEKILPVHHSQLLTYLRLGNKSVGLLLNFNTPRLVDGLKRLVNNIS
jgi:GxxExxY protein